MCKHSARVKHLNDPTLAEIGELSVDLLGVAFLQGMKQGGVLWYLN